MLRIVIASLLVVLAAVAAHAERRVALVIGADRYKAIRKLDNAVGAAPAGLFHPRFPALDVR